MIELFYRYRVHSSQERAFEHAYGPSGPWSLLFAKHRGFRRTRLFRHKKEAGVYVCIDTWDSKADWDAFRAEAADDYARLDRELRMLYLEELLIGYYEGEDEYRAPFDRLT
ncbi:MAG: antibiotic biosynthesis monooxygenase [Candidatus Eremiobacteraeota bacterium]|nr:antibiotic biosynthesis monooxygenase [Candidatus Eremiobacteraeota bacterium]